MYVLGIDPSLTSTGIALLSEEGVILSLAKTNSKQSLAVRLSIIRQTVREMADERPELVCIERPFAGMTKGSAAATVGLGAAYGVALLGLADGLAHGTPVLSVPPTVRAKYATGNGKANKDEVLAAAIRRFGYEGSNNNEADALIFAWIAAEVYALSTGTDIDFTNSTGIGWPGLPQKHYDPIDKWQEWERVL